MMDRANSAFLAALLIVPPVAGCQGDSSGVEDAYQAIVRDYVEGRLDRVYDKIEPETRGMLDAVNRGLALKPELKSLEGRELFKAMWGKNRAGIYPMWLFVPGRVVDVKGSDSSAVLTVEVEPGSTKPALRLTTRKAYMVKQDGVWMVSAASVVKSKLRKAGMTQ
jgi:hypothetical protein